MDKNESERIREYWNEMAERFRDFEVPTPYNSQFMKNLYMNGMLEGGGRALDIGCGGGKYTLALAPYFSMSLGCDISDKMIEGAQRHMDGHKNISFRLLSWQEADIEKLGWEKAFDLVLAHMTPAVNSRAALDKMRRVSRGWCIVTKSVYRNCAVADGVNAICGRAADSYGHREILELLETLWQEGYTPEVFYERERWENCLNEEKAADMYIKRMALRGDISEEKKEGIRRFMASVSENGVVNERTDAVLCTVCWKENGR